MKKIIPKALLKFMTGLIMAGLLLFLPAGSFNYTNAWIFIAVLFIPMLIAGIVLLFKNPALLEERLNARETEATQKAVIAVCAVMFIAGFVIAGLNYRFNWFMLPDPAVYSGSVIFLLSYIMYAEVLRENTYLSRTIKVQQGQKVIDTGLYGIVRHPMYSATVIMFLSIPVILGSLFSFLVFLIYPFTLVRRIKNEEEVLEISLDGYSDYKKRVKYRLIPFIW